MIIAHSATNFLMKKRRFAINLKIFSMPYAVWLFLFSALPMVFVLYYSITNSENNFTLENFFEIKNYSRTFVRSIVFSSISTLISFLLGYPAAYAISKLSKKLQKIVIAGVILQMWISFLLTIYSLMTIMESNGIINKFFNIFGIDCPIINTKIAVIIGMVYGSLPYMILPIYSSLSKLDVKIIEAAQDLGAGKLKIFTKIIFPLSTPGVLSGFLMVFAPNMSSFIISKMLGGSENVLIGEVIELKFLGGQYNPWSGSAIAIILMFFIIICTSVVGYLIYYKSEK